MSDISVEVLERALIHRRRGLPLHLQVQSALRQAIEEHFEDGQSFWTEALLVERLGVSRATVRQALGELSRQGCWCGRRLWEPRCARDRMSPRSAW